jgi:hypothetical protein
MKKLFIATCILIALALTPSRVFAVTCSAENGDVHITSDCSFSGDTGLDAGSGTTNTATLYIDSGAVTVQNLQTIAVGKIVLNGGQLVLPTDGTGSVMPGAAIWMLDADGDTYPANQTEFPQSSSPGAGYVRRSTLSGWELSDVDCYDSGTNAVNAFPGQTTFQSTARGDESWDYNCNGEVTIQYQTCACQTCVEGCPSSPVCTLHQIDTGYTCGFPMTPGPGSCTRVNDGYGTCISCNNGANGSYVVMCL